MRISAPLRLGVATLGIAAALVVTTASSADAWGRHHGRGGRFFFKKPPRQCRAVPELDPGAAGTAIALASGGLAMLRDRRRKGR